MYKIKWFTCLAFSVIATCAGATNNQPLYVGIGSGYGSTTWGNLVAAPDKANMAMSVSTPINVTEGGAVKSVFFGVNLLPTFALEGMFADYPNARAYFDEMSLFTFNHDGLAYFDTQTQTFSFAGKFLVALPHSTKLKPFASAGIAWVHRLDPINDQWRISPTFGVGINYEITDHVACDIGFDYTTGYGEAELDVSQDYVPFLYSGFVRLSYRF